MTLESQQYLKQTSATTDSTGSIKDKKEQLSKKGSARRKGAVPSAFDLGDEQIKIKKDPRVRYYDYRIYLKQ